MKFTAQQMAAQPELLSLKAQVEVAKLMKDKEYLEKEIVRLNSEVLSGDHEAQQEVIDKSSRLREVDRRLAEQFARGEQSGRLKGIVLGKQEAQAGFAQKSSDYERRLAEYEAKLSQSQDKLAAGDPSLQAELGQMRKELAQASSTEKGLREEVAKERVTSATAAQALEGEKKALGLQKLATTRQETRASQAQGKVDEINRRRKSKHWRNGTEIHSNRFVQLKPHRGTKL